VKRGREGLSDHTSANTPPDSTSTAAVSIAIKAPMPGRVVRVLVAAGDRVKARQGVVVVEAMKMENELRAPRDGTVKDIAVAPGAAVESGAVLLVIGD
jgi:biotin carboxyl carrier protein